MSAADLIRAGQTGVADVIRALAPVSAVKTGDQSAPNTTLADDGELAIAVLANKKYLIIQYVNYEGAHSPGDLKIGFSGPAGAVLSYGLLNFNQSAGVGIGNITLNTLSLSSTPALACAGAGTLVSALVFGSLSVSATAGDLTFRFAQFASSATATIVHAGSVLAALPLT